ncbi:MAG TPA: glycosyltransferase family 2 protein [Oscillatoriaceae cyanobacterium]
MVQGFFWFALALVAYAYLGYPLLLWPLARLFGRLNRTGDALPTVSLLIAAHNEDSIIAEKLENSLKLDYPGDRLEIVVVADGCTDRTCEIVRAFADRGVRLIEQVPRQGKASALNLGMRHVRGEIVLCTDANAMYRPDVPRLLVRHFADPHVGMASGVKCVRGHDGAGQGEGLYWRYEGFMKRHDSLLSSAMGATGEIFAMRHALWKPVASDSIIEDFVISMGLIRDGYRVVYDPAAISDELASPSIGEEFKRKVRIVAGAWQAIVRMWPLLLPTSGWIWFQYVSHRVLRWIVVPWLLPLLLAANLALRDTSALYSAFFDAQIVFYALAACGYWLQQRGVRWKLLYVPFYFAFLNYAALVGACRYFRHAQPVTWEMAQRRASKLSE